MTIVGGLLEVWIVVGRAGRRAVGRLCRTSLLLLLMRCNIHSTNRAALARRGRGEQGLQ